MRIFGYILLLKVLTINKTTGIARKARYSVCMYIYMYVYMYNKSKERATRSADRAKEKESRETKTETRGTKIYSKLAYN